MLELGFDPKNGPCVLLTKEAHIVMGKKLREATKRLPAKFEKPDLWKMYQKVYEGETEWLKAIQKYFVE
ncbi:hypothetical protein [Polyangium fumosum]|uniref:Uncharacterized protein n=1 Tax=Polyangium fumosum TaxID=889272 RepID=A0A4U1J7D6_9BACT|nr:hypothetical protein [Polyangium fumosum]TKD03236.1 hypothetical protein E8A74_26215 [Polyangium fumosum]